MRLIDIIEYISDFDSIKLYINGDYYTTVKDKGELTYNALTLKVLKIYVSCDDKRGYLAIDLTRV